VAELTVTLTNELALQLRVTNTGITPFSFTAGYHSYFRVADARTARVEGLQGFRYRDKVLDFAEAADNTPALVPNGETDRVYLGSPARLRLRDADRCLRIESAGFANVVVWNPGPRGDEQYDFAPGEWSQFVCVEPATVFNPVVLGPGKGWVGGHTVCVESGSSS
jgi:glucose-6-phosphate 1-epimerase